MLALSSGCRVRPVRIVNRGGYGHDEGVAAGEVADVGGEAQLADSRQVLLRSFLRVVTPRAQFVDALAADVEAGSIELPAEFHRQRQSHVAEPDNRDSCGWQHRYLHEPVWSTWVASLLEWRGWPIARRVPAHFFTLPVEQTREQRLIESLSGEGKRFTRFSG